MVNALCGDMLTERQEEEPAHWRIRTESSRGNATLQCPDKYIFLLADWAAVLAGAHHYLFDQKMLHYLRV